MGSFGKMKRNSKFWSFRRILDIHREPLLKPYVFGARFHSPFASRAVCVPKSLKKFFANKALSVKKNYVLMKNCFQKQLFKTKNIPNTTGGLTCSRQTSRHSIVLFS